MADGDLNTALESIRHRDEGRTVQSWQARGGGGGGCLPGAPGLVIAGVSTSVRTF